jgi:hypothetical protein
MVVGIVNIKATSFQKIGIPIFLATSAEMKNATIDPAVNDDASIQRHKQNSRSTRVKADV